MTKISEIKHAEKLTVDISVIVPCIDEAHQIPALLRVLREAGKRFDGNWEIIIVDGGSTDGTQALCQAEHGVKMLNTSPSRAAQMNVGAKAAKGRILYFVHADTRPPISCFEDIKSAILDDAQMGGYAFEMDSQRRMLAFNSYLTTFNVIATRGGDQTLFINRELFEGLDGFSESMQIMEEYDLLKRAKKKGVGFTLLKGQTIVSARKYEGRSWLKVQFANSIAMVSWRLGVDSSTIKSRYARMLGE